MTKMVTLVLGASEKPNRYANKAIKELRAAGESVVAVGRKTGAVGDVTIDTQWPDTQLDTITLYLNPSHQVAYYDHLINSGARRVIFNPGTENVELEERLVQNGINAERACTLVLLATKQY